MFPADMVIWDNNKKAGRNQRKQEITGISGGNDHEENFNRDCKIYSKPE